MLLSDEQKEDDVRRPESFLHDPSRSCPIDAIRNVLAELVRLQGAETRVRELVRDCALGPEGVVDAIREALEDKP